MAQEDRRKWERSEVEKSEGFRKLSLLPKKPLQCFLIQRCSYVSQIQRLVLNEWQHIEWDCDHSLSATE